MRTLTHIAKKHPGNGSRRAGAWNVSELIGHVFLHYLIDLPQ
jgi:hypothetical protein